MFGSVDFIAKIASLLGVLCGLVVLTTAASAWFGGEMSATKFGSLAALSLVFLIGSIAVVSGRFSRTAQATFWLALATAIVLHIAEPTVR